MGRNSLIYFNLKQEREKRHRNRGSEKNMQEMKQNSSLGNHYRLLHLSVKRTLKTFEKEMMKVDVKMVIIFL